ncbi:MAG TPA: hypothetical protein VN922_16570 [Bacteroidia bacterium]|nr:hypothetical protein [Bacteroidia bacterium]
MPEEYQSSVFEKIAPILDDYMLAELKIQQLKAKGFKDNKHIDKLQDISSNAQIEIYELVWQNKNQ